MGSCADSIVGLLEQARSGDLGARGRLLESYRDYLTLLARVQIGRRIAPGGCHTACMDSQSACCLPPLRWRRKQRRSGHHVLDQGPIPLPGAPS
jgi:hypothetical protein